MLRAYPATSPCGISACTEPGEKITIGFTAVLTGFRVMNDLPSPDGTRLPIVAITGTEAELLADLGAVTQDIKFVMGCCQRLLTLLAAPEDNGVLVQALFTAALVTYARCFNGGKRSALKVKDLAKLGLDGDVRGFHEQLLAMRSKHIAHSVNPFEMITVGAVLSPIDAESRKVEGIAVMTGRHITFDSEGVRHLGVICARLIDRVIADRASYLQTAALEQARQLDIDDLYRRPSLRAQPPGPSAAGQPRGERDQDPAAASVGEAG